MYKALKTKDSNKTKAIAPPKSKNKHVPLDTPYNDWRVRKDISVWQGVLCFC
jgi:hypothetical protein